MQAFASWAALLQQYDLHGAVRFNLLQVEQGDVVDGREVSWTSFQSMRVMVVSFALVVSFLLATVLLYRYR